MKMIVRWIFSLVLLGAGLQPLYAQKHTEPEFSKWPARDAYYLLREEVKAIEMRLLRSSVEEEKMSKEAYAKLNEELEAQKKRKYQQLKEARKSYESEVEQDAERVFGARHAEIMGNARRELSNGHAFNFDVFNYPRVDGSTSAHPLGILIACRLIGGDYEWTNRYYDTNKSFGGPNLWGRGSDEAYLAKYRLLAKVTPPSRERFGSIINQQVVVHHGTHIAYTSLIKKYADLVLVARLPSDDEKKEALEAGVKLDFRPVALDAFVFIVNQINPVESLSTPQLKNIFSGKTTEWAAVQPGMTEDISAYQRNETSGSQQLMLHTFMRETPLYNGDNEWRYQMIKHMMSRPYSALTGDSNGIAYSVFYYEHFMSGSPYTRTIAVDGVKPTTETIGSGKYPYVTKVYVVTREDEPVDSGARRLRDWLLSPEGQAVVEESGYVPLPVK